MSCRTTCLNLALGGSRRVRPQPENFERLLVARGRDLLEAPCLLHSVLFAPSSCCWCMQQQLLQLLAFAASSFSFDYFLCGLCPSVCPAFAVPLSQLDYRLRFLCLMYKYTMVQAADTVTPYGKRLRARSTNSFSKCYQGPRWQEHHVTSPDRLVRIMTSSRRYRQTRNSKL